MESRNSGNFRRHSSNLPLSNRNNEHTVMARTEAVRTMSLTSAISPNHEPFANSGWAWHGLIVARSQHATHGGGGGGGGGQGIWRGYIWPWEIWRKQGTRKEAWSMQSTRGWEAKAGSPWSWEISAAKLNRQISHTKFTAQPPPPPPPGPCIPFAVSPTPGHVSIPQHPIPHINILC